MYTINIDSVLSFCPSSLPGSWVGEVIHVEEMDGGDNLIPDQPHKELCAPESLAPEILLFTIDMLIYAVLYTIIHRSGVYTARLFRCCRVIISLLI